MIKVKNALKEFKISQLKKSLRNWMTSLRICPDLSLNILTLRYIQLSD